jgi:hypothetical protein
VEQHYITAVFYITMNDINTLEQPLEKYVVVFILEKVGTVLNYWILFMTFSPDGTSLIRVVP